MKIGVNLIGSIRYRWGGRVYAEILLRALAKIDKENDYFLFLSDESNDTFEIDQKNFKRVFCCRKAEKGDMAKIWAEQFLLPKELRRYSIDILFSPNNLAPIFCKIKKMVIVHDVRFFYDMDSPLRNTLKKPIFKIILKSCNRVIAASQNTFNDIVKFVGITSPKLKMIYDMADVNKFSIDITDSKKILERNGIKDNDKYFLFVSAHYPWKNIGELIEIFNIFKKRYGDNHKLAIVGSFDNAVTPALKESVSAFGLDEEVFFLNKIPEMDLVVLYKNSEAFLFTSLFEGFGLPLVEAMAAGTPIISYDATTSPEILGDAGILIKTGDKENFVSKIKMLIDNYDLKKDLVERGKVRAKMFSPDNIAPLILNELIDLSIRK